MQSLEVFDTMGATVRLVRQWTTGACFALPDKPAVAHESTEAKKLGELG